jgi:uncharacterized glyoxalase superfamily protein PhnB
MNRFLSLHPVLQATDVTAAIEWYVDRLGFQLAFRDDPLAPRYAAVRRDQIELHLQWHDETSFRPDRGDALMLRLLVEDPDALFRDYATKGVFHDRTALRDTPWRTREFAFYDLNGHGLTFFRLLASP